MSASVKAEGPGVTYVHLRGQPASPVLRVLRSLDVPFRIATDLATATSNTARVIVLDVDSLSEAELKELERTYRGSTSRTKLLLLSSSIDVARVGELLHRNILTNLVAGTPEQDTADFRVTIQKLLRNDIFGIEKYFGWGVEFSRTSLHSSMAKAALLDKAHRFATKCGVHARIADQFRTVCEELASNALYNAPIAADGESMYRQVPRDRHVTLPGGPSIEVVFTFDGARLGISTTDRFGSMSVESLRQALGRNLVTQQREVQTSSGGAGLGLALTFHSLTQLVINLEPGRCTEMIGLIHAAGSYRDFVQTQKSLNIFVQGAA